MNVDDVKRRIAGFLRAHDRVSSTAGWVGSPNPQDPRNIRRVCKCGTVIGWHERTRRDGVWEPLSGYSFDEPHQEHVSAALAIWLRDELGARALLPNVVEDPNLVLPWDEDQEEA